MRSVAVEPIGTGQTSATYRLTLDADGCAPTMVAKLAEGHEEARRRVATGHRNEVGFYRELVQTLEVRAPYCRYAALNNDATSFTLLLEDLSPRRAGRQSDGCSLPQATQAVLNLARLHASRWNDASLHDVSFVPPLTPDRARFLADLAHSSTETFIGRYDGRLDPNDAATLREVADALYEWQTKHRRPFSVIHGDYRLDNLMLDPAGEDVVAVDWQTLGIALPTRDLAYFIGTSLPSGQRREQEDGLVSAYYDELRRRGVGDYASDRFATDYRIGQLQGPMITTIGSLTSVGPRGRDADEMFLSMARRSCAAVREHRSLEVV